MSIAQIVAILQLLLAFGVPQQTVDNVQGILERSNSQVVQVAPIQGIGGVGKLSTDVPSVVTNNNLKPAYTWDELLQALYDKTPQNQRTGTQSLPQNSYPVIFGTISSTTAVISFQNSVATWGDIFFNNRLVLSKNGNEITNLYEGETYPVHSRQWVSLNDLTPDTTYYYQFVWREAGREDTVITRSFKTLSQ